MPSHTSQQQCFGWGYRYGCYSLLPLSPGGVLANSTLGGLQLFHPFLVLCQHLTGGGDVDMVDVAIAKYSGLSVCQQVRNAYL